MVASFSPSQPTLRERRSMPESPPPAILRETTLG
jgi:hypothetical protein